MFGAESLATIGSHGVGGDLLFATAGLFWATFGILLRLWHVPGTRAIAAGRRRTSILLYAPIYFLIYGYHGLLRQSLFETLLQVGRAGRDRRRRCRSICSRTPSLRSAPAARRRFRLWCRSSASYRISCARRCAELSRSSVGMLIVLVGFHFALRR